MKTPLKILLIALLMNAAPAQAGWYFELAVGLHDADASLPEVDLPGPLGRVVFGLQAQDNFAIEIEHVSSVPAQEQGSGLNTLWFVKRVYFQ